MTENLVSVADAPVLADLHFDSGGRGTPGQLVSNIGGNKPMLPLVSNTNLGIKNFSGTGNYLLHLTKGFSLKLKTLKILKSQNNVVKSKI